MFRGTFTDKFVARTNSEAEQTSVDPLDELAVDESKHYKMKISRYIKNSLMCVSDPDYWFILWTSNYTRGPLLHFYRFLCVKSTSTRLHIVELVANRIDFVMTEFNNLAASVEHWTTMAFQFMSFQGNPGLSLSDTFQSEGSGTCKTILCCIAISLLLNNAAAFDRRVSRVYRRCKAQLHSVWKLGIHTKMHEYTLYRVKVFSSSMDMCM